MFDKTITLFNYSKATDGWFKTVIENVDCIVDEALSPSTRGMNDEYSADIKIQANPDKSIVAKGGSTKTYVGPKIYAADSAPSGKFTFTPELDFIMIGDYSSLVLSAESTYDTGLYDAMNSQYDDVYIIKKAVFYGLLPHFEVGGR